MEEDLNNTTHTLKVLFEQMPWMVALVKIKDDTIVKVNKVFEDVSGFSCNDVLGHSLKTLELIIKPSDLNIFKKRVIEEEGVSKFSIIFKNKKENMFKGTLSVCRILYDNELCILYMINDIVAPKKVV